MTYPAYCLLPILAVAAALGGCGALERLPEPAFPSEKPGIASVGPGARPAHEVRSAAGPGIEPAPEVRPADSRLRLNLHVFGLSYHTDRGGTRVSHLDNEFNVGLGLNYEFHNDARGVAGLETGFFRDSGRNWAKFAGTSYQFKLGERWRFGADLLAVQSETYNKGRGFVAPLPRLTYDFGAVKLNAIYVPRVPQYNRFAAFGFYFTLPFGK